MKTDCTQIRYISSKDLDKIISYVVGLPYKIEVKGNPIYNGKKYILFFTLLPEVVLKEVPHGDLD